MGVHHETQRESLRFSCGVKEAYGETHKKENQSIRLNNDGEYTSDLFLQQCHDEDIEWHSQLGKHRNRLG